MSKFLDNFRKSASKIKGVSIIIHEPTFYLDSGNYIINKLLYGEYGKCLPQGKMSAIAGPSATGKTFVASNVARYALESGIGVLYVDTENAIDNGHFEAIGIDPEHENLQYVSLNTITQAVKTISTFISDYRDSGETMPFLIVVDSLDMLQTDSDAENYEKGDQKGGQGQKEKQLKKMLAAFVHDIKTVPMHMICTKQVYVNQDDATKYIEPWKFTEALKFAFSQILLVTKLSLRDDKTKEYLGFTLKAFGLKTRFTKPFQVAEIQVPYDSGMDRFTGMLKAAISLGVVTQGGAWYYFGDDKWQGEANWTPYKEKIRDAVFKLESQDLMVQIDGEEETGEAEPADTSETELTPKEIVKKKFGKK